MKRQLDLEVLAPTPLRVADADEAGIRARDQHAADELRDLVGQIITARSRKTAAYELDVQPSLLSDALAGESKQLQLRWLPTLIRIAPPALRDALRDRLLAMFEDDQPPTPEEELANLKEAVLAELGTTGARIVESARRRRRKGGRP